MNFKLTSPCANCPFRTDINFYLRPGRREEIVEALRNDQIFACHKTLDGEWDDEGRYAITGTESHCAGALIVMKKSNELADNYMYRMAQVVGIFDPEKLNMGAPVEDSLELFETAQGG